IEIDGTRIRPTKREAASEYEALCRIKQTFQIRLALRIPLHRRHEQRFKCTPTEAIEPFQSLPQWLAQRRCLLREIDFIPLPHTTLDACRIFLHVGWRECSGTGSLCGKMLIEKKLCEFL